MISLVRGCGQCITTDNCDALLYDKWHSLNIWCLLPILDPTNPKPHFNTAKAKTGIKDRRNALDASTSHVSLN